MNKINELDEIVVRYNLHGNGPLRADVIRAFVVDLKKEDLVTGANQELITCMLTDYEIGSLRSVLKDGWGHQFLSKLVSNNKLVQNHKLMSPQSLPQECLLYCYLNNARPSTEYVRKISDAAGRDDTLLAVVKKLSAIVKNY